MAFSYIHFKMKKYRIVDDIKRIKSFIQFEYLLCCLITHVSLVLFVCAVGSRDQSSHQAWWQGHRSNS